MTAAEARHWFPQFLEAVDQPSIDGFNSFCVAQVARDHGQKVVLSGLGGDELFAGYPSFRLLPQWLGWGRYAAGLGPLARAAAPCLGRLPSLKLRRLLDFAQRSDCLTSAYYGLRSNFSHQEALALLAHHLPDAPPPALPEPDLADQPSLADRISALEMNRYMANQLLRDSDVMTMAWGLELRVPLVDRVLLETIAAIPSPQRLALGKQLLVQAVPEIPEWVVNRPKRGFRFPFDQWLTADWSLPGEAIPCPAWIPLQPWYRRWSLIMLHHWQQSLVNG
jgi:asparagine synthase (glutamine-hydrolysing)